MTDDFSTILSDFPEELAEPGWLSGPEDSSSHEPGAPAWIADAVSPAGQAEAAPPVTILLAPEPPAFLPEAEEATAAALTLMEDAVRSAGTVVVEPAWIEAEESGSPSLPGPPLPEPLGNAPPEDLPAWAAQTQEPTSPSAAAEAESALSNVLRDIATNMVYPRPEHELESGTDAAATAAAAAVTERYVVFFLASSRFALPIDSVLEVSTVPRITAVPSVPHYVRGVANLRGEILPVLDLRAMLGLPRFGNAVLERLLVVRSHDRESVAGFVVDRVRGLTHLDTGKIGQPRGPVEDIVMRFLDGVGEHEDQVLNVMNPRKVFESEEVRRLARN